MATQSNKRSKLATTLSRMISLEEIIIDTVHEILNKEVSEVTAAMDKSDFKKKLMDVRSDYYKNDPNLLVAEFMRECKEKLGWKLD